MDKMDIKNRTVNVDYYSDTSIVDIIREIEDIVGKDSVVYACPGQGNIEITFDNFNKIDLLHESPIIVNNQELKFRPIGTKYMIVSFMHIPGYISDHEILARLEEWNVRPIGTMRRRFIKYDDREIPDGTRYIKCEFPPNISSLPYATTFDRRSFIVKHNNQEKVCFGCLSPNHEVRNCPESLCRRCGQKGHIKKYCEETICENCNEYNHKCRCIEHSSVNSCDSPNTCSNNTEYNELSEITQPNTSNLTYTDNPKASDPKAPRSLPDGEDKIRAK